MDFPEREIDICRLEQACIEDKYCKKDTKAKIIKEIQKTLNTKDSNEFKNRISLASESISNFFNGKYYPSKENRLKAFSDVCDLSYSEIVIEICVLTLPHTSPVSIQSVVGKLAKFFEYPNIWHSIRTAAEIITVVCIGSNLYDLIPARFSSTGSIMLKSNYSLDDNMLVKLNNLKYLPPLVCEPLEIKTNTDSGYLGKNASVILGKDNHHEHPLALDVLNIANNVELSLDPWVLSLEETSKKPLDTLDKKKEFKLLQVSSREVYEELLEQGNRFFFDWRFDKRGRMYSSGYHVNIQSTEYKKALINLANPEIVEL